MIGGCHSPRAEPLPWPTARFGSALTVADFQKDVHVITLTRAALEQAAPTVAAIARAEGLAAHADSVLRRLQTEG